MKKTIIGKLFFITMLICVANVVFADRGAGKKSKVKTVLNVTTIPGTSFKNSLLTNFKTGLVYKGSLLTNTNVQTTRSMGASLMTFQKGNTTYILPYKSRITVPEMKQGYAGVKLIIRSNK